MEEITLQKLVNEYIEAKRHETWHFGCITKDDIDKYKSGYSNFSRDITFWKYIRQAVYRYAFVLAYEGNYNSFKSLKSIILKERNKINVKKYIMIDHDTELEILIELLTEYFFYTSSCYGSDIIHRQQNKLLQAAEYTGHRDLYIAKNIDRFADWELHERDYMLSVRVSSIVETIVDSIDQ